MLFVKVLLVLSAVCCTAQADLVSSLPIVGGVLGSLQNASTSLINTAVDAGEQIIGRVSAFESMITNRIKALLKEFRNLMFDNIELLGLPRLEPFELGHVDINISHEIGIFEGTMDNVVVTGLSNFVVDNVGTVISSKLPLITMDPNVTINLHYDILNVSGEYDIEAYVGDLFNIYGKGKFALNLRGLKIDANAKVIIELTKQIIRIDEVYVDIKLDNMTCNFENLMGGGENGKLFNKIIGELAPEAVEVLWPEIRPGVEATVKKVGNLKITELGYAKVIEILLPFLKPKPTTTTVSS